MKVVKGSHKGLDSDKNGRLMVKRDMHMCVRCLVVFRTVVPVTVLALV